MKPAISLQVRLPRDPDKALEMRVFIGEFQRSGYDFQGYASVNYHIEVKKKRVWAFKQNNPYTLKNFSTSKQVFQI